MVSVVEVCSKLKGSSPVSDCLAHIQELLELFFKGVMAIHFGVRVGLIKSIFRDKGFCDKGFKFRVGQLYLKYLDECVKTEGMISMKMRQNDGNYWTVVTCDGKQSFKIKRSQKLVILEAVTLLQLANMKPENYLPITFASLKA